MAAKEKGSPDPSQKKIEFKVRKENGFVRFVKETSGMYDSLWAHSYRKELWNAMMDEIWREMKEREKKDREAMPSGILRFFGNEKEGFCTKHGLVFLKKDGKCPVCLAYEKGEIKCPICGNKIKGK